MEDSIKASEERYKSLFNGMSEGFALHEIICDDKGKPVDYRFLDVNSSFERLTGLKKADIIGKTKNKVLPGDSSEWVDKYGKVALTGEPVHFENYSPVLKKHYNVFAYSPAPKQFAVVFMDITRRKNAETALQERENQLKTAQHIAHVGSWNLDIISNKLHWSDEVYRIFEIDKKMFNASYETFLELIHPDDRQMVNTAYARSLSTKIPYDIVHRLKMPNGRIKYVREICETKYDDSGKPVQSTGSVQDITEQKLAEEVLKRDKDTFEKLVSDRTRELLNTQLELGRSRRLSDIGTLAATVAHELRNPLGVIRTAIYNIRRKTQGQPLEGHINNIEKKIAESDQIINNLLGYSRIKMPQYEKVKIYYIIDECINFAEERFEKINISFLKDFKAIKDVYVDIDPFQMREVFNNIIDNACHAVDDKGEIKVSAKLLGQSIKVSFKDNGIGISKEDLEKIFEPFFTRKSKGTGLGLTICKELISLHRGHLKIESVEKQGTLVTITLPVNKEN